MAHDGTTDSRDDFELFLQGKGLKCEVREEHLPNGGKVIEYFSKTVGVQIQRDRGRWGTCMKDVLHYPGYWFTIERLAKILDPNLTPGSSISDQLTFLKEHWDQLVELFSDERRESTLLRCKAMFHEEFAARRKRE